MKSSINKIPFLLFITMFFVTLLANAQSPSVKMTDKQAAQWLNKNVFTHRQKISPHKSTNFGVFAYQYNKNKVVWDKVFKYLKETNLEELKPGKYEIDGDLAFVTIAEGPTKSIENAKWEAHKKYLDIQYVISGKEKIGLAKESNAKITLSYSEEKDFSNYEAEGTNYEANPSVFFLFFPSDAHRPGIKVEGVENDKKAVFKIKLVN